MSSPDLAHFLPRTRAEMAARGWDELDVLLVTGDAYVDHPSFGAAAIGRLLEAEGWRVGMLDVPELDDGWERLPAPRLFVGVTAGTIDSMVTNYTASKRKRREDVYRPGGVPGRPNRATISYTAQARHLDGQLAGECVGQQTPRAEACNGIDDDCDGSTDEGFGLLGDCNGGVGACLSQGIIVCTPGGGGGTVCDFDVIPPGVEDCDGGDEDCDGSADEGCRCRDGETDPCGINTGACEFGEQVCNNGEFGPCQGGVNPGAEDCNGGDEDCDGTVDEGCVCLEGTTDDCGQDVGACAFGTTTCAANGRWGSCLGGVNPGAEDCSGGDEDCDGSVDEGCLCVEGVREACGESRGDCVQGTRTCLATGRFGGCIGAIGPDYQDICEGYNDEDCDGLTDEGCACINGNLTPCGSNVGACRAGTRNCVNGVLQVCLGEITPTGESCNGADDDCDTETDESYPDLGNACAVGIGFCRTVGVRVCRPDGSGTQCNAIAGNPRIEVCNGIDDNCDGTTDEGACGDGAAPPG